MVSTSGCPIKVKPSWSSYKKHQALILLRDFNDTDVFWKSNTESCNQFRRLLDSIEDKFLVQVIDSPTRGEMLVDVLLTNADKLIKEVKIGDTLAFSDHTLVEFNLPLRRQKEGKNIKGDLFFISIQFSLKLA